MLRGKECCVCPEARYWKACLLPAYPRDRYGFAFRMGANIAENGGVHLGEEELWKGRAVFAGLSTVLCR